MKIYPFFLSGWKGGRYALSNVHSLLMFHIAHDSLVQTHARGRELYDHYTGLLDQYFRSQLQVEDPVYLDTVYRRVLLAPAACFPFMEDTPWYKSASGWFRRDALSILHPKGDQRYIELFRNFITDPQRAGRFVARGDVYATITIDLIRQLIAEFV